jgi:hypothetical protein
VKIETVGFLVSGGQKNLKKITKNIFGLFNDLLTL